MGFNILPLFRPAVALLPEVANPTQKLAFRSRAIQTVIIVLIYLVCSQIPLYGIVSQDSADSFRWLRTILASNRGSLMELGISPTVTAGMVMQLLVGAKLIEYNNKDKNEESLYNGAQKVLGLLIAMCEAIAYVYSGMYGPLEQIGAGGAILIILQLTFAGVIVSLLDELLSKGYGVGNSAISLFIAINMCENILWKSFSPMSHPSQFMEYEYEGSIINLFHSLIVHPDKFAAIKNAFYRSRFPNINSLIATCLIFLVVIYFQGFRVDLPMSHQRVKGLIQPYPIKLFYTSNIPIILQSALISNLFFISQMLYRKFGGNFLVGLLGKWQEIEMGGHQSVPVGGLAYYISPPQGFTELFTDPIHCAFYIVFMLGTCGLFSKTWIEVSGSGVNDVARQLKEQSLTYKGFTEAGTKKQLKRLIPVAAAFGGICIGALSIIADFMGVIGSGTGMLLAVTIVYGYFEQIRKEKEQGTLDLW
ncbi:SecY subunit domain [Pseudocohnilembus persalinus]|uniref:SecY subunit domain n=1 Tax=Pseudocohnilembus persalinus TaxID=266149 RepID=A0A0V0R4T6_PSEPJ|nr:SecY subunit domain [Pseudocohnilembus persalinus]|eukprot:KRX09224.1 SecY subunit domain [Pseudocohnilembus persalinus]